jgi:hypothetical protein
MSLFRNMCFFLAGGYIARKTLEEMRPKEDNLCRASDQQRIEITQQINYATEKRDFKQLIVIWSRCNGWDASLAQHAENAMYYVSPELVDMVRRTNGDILSPENEHRYLEILGPSPEEERRREQEEKEEKIRQSLCQSLDAIIESLKH